jgi:hypothetical protein
VEEERKDVEAAKHATEARGSNAVRVLLVRRMAVRRMAVRRMATTLETNRPTMNEPRWALHALAIAAVLPLLSAPTLTRELADRLSRHAAAQLLTVAHALASVHVWQEPRPLPPTPDARAIASLQDALPIGDTKGGGMVVARAGDPRSIDGRGSQAVAAAHPALPKAVSVLVRRSRVRAAAQAGIRPSGSPVPATTFRSAGLALIGVGGIGVGLRDGDVLTRAGGTPARSDAAIVGAVTAALQRGHPAISAEVWRGTQRIIVTVELPKLRRRIDQRDAAKPAKLERRAKPERDQHSRAGAPKKMQ